MHFYTSRCGSLSQIFGRSSSWQLDRSEPRPWPSKGSKSFMRIFGMSLLWIGGFAFLLVWWTDIAAGRVFQVCTVKPVKFCCPAWHRDSSGNDGGRGLALSCHWHPQSASPRCLARSHASANHTTTLRDTHHCLQRHFPGGRNIHPGCRQLHGCCPKRSREEQEVSPSTVQNDALRTRDAAECLGAPGQADMAVSSSIGSNIFDILAARHDQLSCESRMTWTRTGCEHRWGLVSERTGAHVTEVGLPIPWLLKCTLEANNPEFNGVSIQSPYLMFYTCLLLGMVFGTVISIKLCGWKLQKALGGCMAALYFVFIITTVVVELSRPTWLMTNPPLS